MIYPPGHPLRRETARMWKDYHVHRMTLEQVAEKYHYSVSGVLSRFESQGLKRRPAHINYRRQVA